MNDHQWLWYYLNIQKDEEEDEKKWKARLDYVGWWIDPELAKRVNELTSNPNSPTQFGIGMEDSGDDDVIIVKGDLVTNTSFEEELQKALGEEQTTTFTELPDSVNVGNVNESANDFIKRALNMDLEAMNFNSEIPGIDEDDIDYFEYPEE